MAEDLTGETFEAAFRKWRRFDPGRGTPRAWLLAIARSTALDWFRADARRRKREERVGTEDRPTELAPFGEGFSAELAESLQSLSAGEREVVALRIVLDFSEPVAAVIKQQRDGRFKVSLRSRGSHDVAAVASTFGGGGHRLAAGYTSPYGLARTIETLTSALRTRP